MGNKTVTSRKYQKHLNPEDLLPLDNIMCITKCKAAFCAFFCHFDRDAVYMLTSLDISSGKYSTRDIVLPTPGTATILPGNKTAERYRGVTEFIALKNTHDVLCSTG